MKLKNFISVICLIVPSFLYANPQSSQLQEYEIEAYLKKFDEKMNFISTYRNASKSFREKKEYTLQEEKDYMCNLKLLYSDFINFQSKDLRFENISEIQTLHRQTEDIYRDLNMSLKRLQVPCSEEIVNVPVDPF